MKVNKVFLWSVFDKFSLQFVQLIVLLIMARFLGPEEFGAVAICLAFISIFQVFVDGGLTSALIRKNKVSPEDLNTVFYTNLLISMILTLLIIVYSKYLIAFFEVDMSPLILNVMAILLISNSLQIVQKAIYMIDLKFKSLLKFNLVGAVTGGGVGILLAINNFGPWALVTQTVISSLITCFTIWLASEWRPKFIFSKKCFDELVGFGFFVALTGLIDSIYKNVLVLLIGKYYSLLDVGLFSQAKKLTELPAITYTSAIKSANFTLASKADDEEKLRQQFDNSLFYTSVVYIPLACFFYFNSKEIILIVLGEDWVGANLYFKLLVVALSFLPIHSINLNILQVKGFSKLVVRIEIVKKMILTMLLFILFDYGVVGICYALIFSNIISLFINSHYTNKMINISLFKQCKYILCGLLLGGVINTLMNYLFIYKNNVFFVALKFLLMLVMLYGSVIFLAKKRSI